MIKIQKIYKKGNVLIAVRLDYIKQYKSDQNIDSNIIPNLCSKLYKLFINGYIY